MNWKVIKPRHYNASQLACCQPLLRQTPCHEQDHVQMMCLVITQAHQAVSRCSVASTTAASSVSTTQQHSTRNSKFHGKTCATVSTKLIVPFLFQEGPKLNKQILLLNQVPLLLTEHGFVFHAVWYT